MVVKDKILYCKILEAQDLYPANVKQLDTYCSVQIEGGEERKTPTIWNEPAPYFGEEIVIDNHLPPELKRVTIEVFQEMKGQDRSLGMVMLPRDTLEDSTLAEEQWYSVNQYADDSVSGDVRVDAEFIEGGTAIRINGVECRDVDQSVIDDSVAGKTHVMLGIDLLPDPEAHNLVMVPLKLNNAGLLGSESPTIVPITNVATQTFHMSLWTGNENVGWTFRGHLNVPLASPTCPIQNPGQRWCSFMRRLTTLNRPVKKVGTDYSEVRGLIKNLQSTPVHKGKSKAHKFRQHTIEASTVYCKHCGLSAPPKVALSACTGCKTFYHSACAKFAVPDCGAIPVVRLKLNYTSSTILPLQNYMPFLDVLSEKNYLLAHVFGKCSVKDKVMAATSFIKLEEARDKVNDFLMSVISREIDDTPTAETLFRGNSMASKAVDSYMKHLGLPYLKRTLGDIIKSIASKRINCELDSTRLDPGEDVSKNIKILSELCTKIFDAIYDTRYQIPVAWKPIFAHIQSEVIKKWPKAETVRYTSVSGFLFLRFFAPAVLGPRLFGLLSEYVHPKTARTFTLLAKVLQSLSNLVLFGQKEPYMMPMNAFIESHTQKFKDYIDCISMPVAVPKSVNMHYIDYETAREAARLFHIYIKTTPEILKNLGPEDSELGLKLVRALTRLTVDTTAADVQTSNNPFSFPGLKKSYASFINLGNLKESPSGLPPSKDGEGTKKKKKKTGDGAKKKKSAKTSGTQTVDDQNQVEESDIVVNDQPENTYTIDEEADETDQYQQQDTQFQQNQYGQQYQHDQQQQFQTTPSFAQSNNGPVTSGGRSDITALGGNLGNVINQLIAGRDNGLVPTQKPSFLGNFSPEEREMLRTTYANMPGVMLDVTGNISNIACNACNGPLNIYMKPVVLSGMGWHLEHFICIRCRTALTMESAMLVDDVLYCQNHVARSTCFKCKGTLKDAVYTVGEMDFHPDCFVCDACGNSIKTGFIPFGDKLYCRDDYYRYSGMTCAKCGNPTDGEFIEIGGLKYHLHCRTCDQCGNSIANKRFALVGDELYCEDHFETE